MEIAPSRLPKLVLGTSAGLVAGYLTWRYFSRFPRQSSSKNVVIGSSTVRTSSDKLHDELAQVVAEEAAFMAAEVGFDVEAEEQQCANLAHLLLRLRASQGCIGHQLSELQKLMWVYKVQIRDFYWCLQRKEELQHASDALLDLLSSDENRDLAEELQKGCSIPELNAAIEAVRHVLSVEIDSEQAGGCCGGGCGGGGCGGGSKEKQAAPTASGCCGGGCGGVDEEKQRAPTRGCCGGGGCGSGGGGCGSIEADAANQEIISSPVSDQDCAPGGCQSCPSQGGCSARNRGDEEHKPALNVSSSGALKLGL